MVVIEGNNTPIGRFGFALGYGLVAALFGGSLYFVVLATTGYELGVVAIVVGFLVGAAVREGSSCKGGLAYQVMAVALTYCAIVFTYVPFMSAAIVDYDSVVSETERGAIVDYDSVVSETEAGATVSGMKAGAPPLTSTHSPDEPFIIAELDGNVASAPMSSPAGGGRVGLLGLLLTAAAYPVRAGLENVVGLIIIGVGLYQAWVLNRRDPVDLREALNRSPSR